MNILFVDHACHRKTRSVDFLVALLREQHSVNVHYYERYYDCKLSQAEVDAADLVLFFEFLPDRYRIAISGKSCLFVPMYDNEWGSKWQWRRIARSNMSVLSFCDAVTRHALACGVKNILTVHFAFDPEKFKDNAPGGPLRALFWDRGDITETAVRALLPPEVKLTVQRDFVAREEYEEFLNQFGIYIAPRRKEGIGMAFLEQLARGKCVIAHDDATMNEYISDGYNGFLRDLSAANSPLTPEQLASVCKNTLVVAHKHYARWIEDRKLIPDFINRSASIKAHQGGFTDFLRYLRFLIEGICFRMFG